jgi:hypothetical protein
MTPGDAYEIFTDLAGPVATVIAAVAAAFVAFRLGKAQVEIARRNWQTANEKVVLVCSRSA